jgi:NADH dehydrogenase
LARPRIIIIGGGFGGLACAKALRKVDADLTLVDRRNHHLFQPLLYQVATAALAPSDIAEPLRAILAHQKNTDVMLADVERVDLDARQVHTADGRALPYDKLVVATGARTSWFGNDAWETDAPGLKTLGDALDIRARVLSAFEQAEWAADPVERGRLLTFVVVGGGPTGVEMAGAIQELARHTLRREFRHIDAAATRVILVEAGPRILSTFEADQSDRARAQLESLGVTVWTGRRVQEVGAGRILIDGEELRPGAIIWAAGVQASPLGARLGAPTDRAGRVIVEPDLTLPGHPEVFVIGDLASYAHGLERPLPGVAPVALAQGAYAARCIRADLAGQPRPAFRYVDKGNLATIGYNRAVTEIFGLKLSGYIAWLLWVFVHLLTIVGHRSRMVVFVKWAWAWWTSDRSSRLLWREDEGRPR